MLRDLECSRTEKMVHQCGPIYSTEIIAIVQCMYTDHVWNGGSGELVGDFLMVGVESPNENGSPMLVYDCLT